MLILLKQIVVEIAKVSIKQTVKQLLRRVMDIIDKDATKRSGNITIWVLLRTNMANTYLGLANLEPRLG